MQRWRSPLIATLSPFLRVRDVLTIPPSALDRKIGPPAPLGRSIVQAEMRRLSIGAVQAALAAECWMAPHQISVGAGAHVVVASSTLGVWRCGTRTIPQRSPSVAIGL